MFGVLNELGVFIIPIVLLVLIVLLALMITFYHGYKHGFMKAHHRYDFVTGKISPGDHTDTCPPFHFTEFNCINCKLSRECVINKTSAVAIKSGIKRFSSAHE